MSREEPIGAAPEDMDAAVRERCDRRLVSEGLEDGGEILSVGQEAHDSGLISHWEAAPALRKLLLALRPQPWNVTELTDGWQHRAKERTWESVEPRDRVGSGTPPSQGPFTEIVSTDYEAGEPGCLCDGRVAAWMTAFVIGCDLNELIKARRAAMDEAEIS